MHFSRPTVHSRRRAVRRSEHRPRPSVEREQARARRAGGSQDVALYACVCGYAFRAPVTTAVACPHCGTGQAW